MSQHNRDEEYIKIIERLLPPKSNEEKIKDIENTMVNLATKNDLSNILSRISGIEKDYMSKGHIIVGLITIIGALIVSSASLVVAVIK